MDYRNIESTQATITSYLDAFTKMREFCQDVEPSANESNHRAVLPIAWRPVGRYDANKLRQSANHLSATHARLLEDFSGKARYLAKGYWDYDAFFKVSWQLRIPFNIYAWECARVTYPNGFDDDGNPIGKPKRIPATMSDWCSPQYLTLGEISSWAMRQWSLPEWQAKHQEIECFMDDNPALKEKYRGAVLNADKEFAKWQNALKDMAELSATFS